MDINVLSNYRPLSQLPTLAKIFERIISKQLINYLNSKNLFDKYLDIENCIVLTKFYSTLLTTSYITLIITLLHK